MILMKGIDIHCHLEYMADTEEEQQKIINNVSKKISAIITSIADPKKMQEMIHLRKRNPEILFLSAGFHPIHLKEYNENQIEKYIKQIENHLADICAIGEIGLDYHYIKEEAEIQRMKNIFADFLKLAEKLKKPVIIHARGSENKNIFEDVFSMLDHKKLTVIFHLFSGNMQELKYALEHNYYISINTAICKSKKYKKIAKNTPIEKILLETDAPWMDPNSNELKNRPWNIIQSAEKIAEIKHLSTKYILELTEQNARRIFRI